MIIIIILQLLLYKCRKDANFISKGCKNTAVNIK